MQKKPRVHRHEVTQPLDKSYRLIPLTQGQNALVDAEDFEWLNQWNWTAHWQPTNRSYYAVRCIPGIIKKQNQIKMHRVIMGCKLGEQIDHHSQNTLDNRKQNLRQCTPTQNSQNRKSCYGRFKGARWEKQSEKWRSSIRIHGQHKHLGIFGSEQEAALAYDAAAKIYFGEFALLNFPDQGSGTDAQTSLDKTLSAG